MKSILWENKQKKIETLSQQLKDVTTDRDTLLQTVKDHEKKLEQFNQSAAVFALGSQGWEKEKQTLIEAHTKALAEVEAKLKTVNTEKETLINEHKLAVEKLTEQHEADAVVTDEKVNKQAAVKLNAMNLSDTELPAVKEESLTLEQARKTLASLSGNEKREFYKEHKQMFEAYLRNPNAQ